MSSRPLTIGMATCDDFDGVYFTVTSLLIHHPDVLNDCEFVVVDNNPGSRQGQAVRDWLLKRVPNVAYHPFPGPYGTAPARNEVFRHATTEFVLCLDCHVLLAPGAVRRLLDYFRDQPDCRDLITGPLLHDDGTIAATHQRAAWSSGAWGVWAIDERGLDAEAPAFEIWQQGMGLFACRRDAWVAFHPEFRGFGGCESYVMEKFRRQGGRVVCCPWLRWTHRFQRPLGAPYRVSRRDAHRNYLIGFRELGLDTEPVERHFAQILGTPERSNGRDPAVSNGSLAVIGDRELGSVNMRGSVLALHFQCALIGPRELSDQTRWETAVVVKHCSPNVRSAADRLVYDPLDVFWDDANARDPRTFWRRKHAELNFDEIIATSPACQVVMREALPERVQVHLVPHPPDSRINPTWGDPEGPVVYVGQSEFIESGIDRIRVACGLLNRELVTGTSCELLKGASLALALRLPPFDTPLNRHCKPQVKIANAIAAGVPVVTTDCPAATSLYPGIPSVPVHFSPQQLADAMRMALQGERRWPAFWTDNYLTAMNRLLGIPAWIVYTACYGGSPAPAEPRERISGTQYICFTDNPRLKADGWSLRTVARSRNPVLQAKGCKILAHEAIDCDASLWIDGRRTLHSLAGAFEQLAADVALPQHDGRSCIYAEAERCKSTGRGDPARIDRSIARYRGEAHPDGFGLWDTDIVLRRHSAIVEAFNAEWWREVSTGSPQDQLSLPVVLRRLSVPFETLPPRRPRISAAARPR